MVNLEDTNDFNSERIVNGLVWYKIAWKGIFCVKTPLRSPHWKPHTFPNSSITIVMSG